VTSTPRAAATGTTFRPDIEGLRAIAVLAVLAYHARIPGISGGYIGVDVFFVVSGFLISGLIVRELQATGTVDLATFYARRARRLLPAALVVIAATVVASAILLPPLRVGDVALDGAASALYVGNIRYAAQATDYLQAELDPSPLLHFWSLGVEEQFYLVWPALLLLVAGRHPNGHGTALRRIAIVVSLIAIGSLVLSVLLTPTDAPLAFFILPTRAWELAVGAGLVLAATRLQRLPAPLASAFVLAGLGAIAISAVAYDLTTPFPGTAAILPVAGAALIIAGGMRTPHGPLSRTLSIAPMRWIGGISYSLYLWHWPLLVLPAATIGAPLPGVARLALVAATFVLAAASKRWIEDPIRHGGPARMLTPRILAMAGALSLAVAVGSVGLGAAISPPTTVASSDDIALDLPDQAPPDTSEPSVTTGPGPTTPRPTRAATAAGPVPGDLVPSLGAVRDDLPIVYEDGCHASAADMPTIDDLDTCVYGDPAADTTVVVIGDSHAAQWFPALERLADAQPWRLVSITKSACPSIDTDVDIYNPTLKRPYPECAAWMDLTLARIAAESPDLVVIANARSTRFVIDGAAVRSTDRDDLWGAGLGATIRAARSSGASVVVIGDTPDPAGDPPVCLSDHLDDALACATPSDVAITASRLATERAVAAENGATFIDPSDWLCPTEPCPAVIGRLLVFRDSHHMTTPFARALAPYLEALLPRIDR
jgi:peptidoglycan/LPS O-acetylase OafA/YrhL